MRSPTFRRPRRSSYSQSSRLLCFCLSLTLCRSQLLITNGSHTRGKSIHSDEASSITLLVYMFFAESNEALIVQSVLAFTTDDRSSSLEEFEGDGSGNALLRDVYESIVGLALRRPPAAVVYEIRIARGDEVLGGKRATIQNELLELAVRGVEQGAAGGFVNTT